MRELQKVDLLSKEEEKELWRRFKQQGDLAARAKIISSYQPLVFKIVAEMHPRQAIIMDMIQEGTLGLIDAVERFDPGRSYMFSTYAPFRIRGTVINYIEREKLKGARVDYDDDLLKVIRVGPEDEDRFASDLATSDRFEKLVECVGRLPDKERRVMEALFLHDKPSEYLLNEMQISPSYLSRLKKKAVRRLRAMMAKGAK